MSDSKPRFNQLNLVVRDIDAALAFYKALGLTVQSDGGEWPPGSGARHVSLENGDGPLLELDNMKMARIWHGGRQEWEAGRDTGDTVIGFSLGSREEVDQLYGDLIGAGYLGRQAPYDAFWGARYAIVADPDGHDCGLMSPVDPAEKYTPET